MSVQHARPPVGLAQWDEDWAPLEDDYELVRGVPLVVPSESLPNLGGATLLSHHLYQALGTRVRCYPGAELLLEPDPTPTVRRPDLVVMSRARQGAGYRLQAEDVLVVVEFLSPSTARVDLGDKQLQYASAGIPVYLVVDLRDLGSEDLILLTEPAQHGYRSSFRGSMITMPVGSSTVKVSVTDLL